MPELEDLISGAEAAQYLGVSHTRLYAIARTGKIGQQVAGYWMFTRKELDTWKAQRNPRGGRPKDGSPIRTPTDRGIDNEA